MQQFLMNFFFVNFKQHKFLSTIVNVAVFDCLRLNMLVNVMHLMEGKAAFIVLCNGLASFSLIENLEKTKWVMFF